MSESLPDPTAVDEQASLERARFMSTLLDEAVRVPGTDYKVGIDPVLGVLPVGGDAVAATLSLSIVLEGVRMGIPREMALKMLGLIAVDFAGGSVPVVGPLFDAYWKANKWNVDMLEEFVESRAEEEVTIAVEG